MFNFIKSQAILATIKSDIMATINACTGDQMTLDGPQRKGDLRRSRAAAEKSRFDVVLKAAAASKANAIKAVRETTGLSLKAAKPDFKFDLQLFAEKANNHIARKSYIKALKSQKGVAMAYNLKVLPVGKEDFRFIINREFAQVTPLSEHYLATNIEMFNLIGRKVNVKRGYIGYATLDLSALACAHSNTLRTWAKSIANIEIVLGEHKGRAVAGIHGDGTDFVLVKSGTSTRRNGERVLIPYSEVVDATTGHTRPGWNRFKDYKIFGASKGRKSLFDLFEQDSSFEDLIGIATYGEYDKVKSMTLTAKETAEAVTRLGSKSCGLGSQDIAVDNITIVLGKDSATDGAGLVSNIRTLIPGYIIQCRPYTAKGAALTIAPDAMELAESHYNCVVWDKHSLTAEQEAMLDIILNKCDRRLSGMNLDDIIAKVGGNAIRLVGDPTNETQVFGDLNFWKDKWDYSRVSGLNVVDVACFTGDDFNDAATSGQMLKLLLGCKASNELGDKISRFLRGIITTEVAEKFSNKGSGRFDGTEMISTEYAAGVFKTYNPASWMTTPSIYRMVLKEQINSLSDMFDRDRYHVPGHSAMATVDVAYFLTGGRKRLLNIEVKDGKILSFEVYDPVANRYYNEATGSPEKGFVVKYPSMGTKEGCIVCFISDEEMKHRIDSLDTTDDIKRIIWGEISAFKEGGAMCPADLDILAMVLAGYDLDGDHLEIFFSTPDGVSIPELLIESGFVGAAINIESPAETGTLETQFSMKRWAEYSAMIIDMENKSVGAVTNTFRLFTDGLLQDLDDPEVLSFYKKLLVAIGATYGNNNYKSVVQTVEVKGVETYFIVADAMEKFITNAIKDINLDNPDNVHVLLEDMDKLGRACQELTIDAQKKFFPVFCDWMDDTADFSLFCLKYGVNFTVDFDAKGNIILGFSKNNGYTYDSSKGLFVKSATVVAEKANGRTKYTMADAFTRYRVFAINHVYKALRAAKEQYNAAMAAWAAAQTERDCRLMVLNMSMNAIGIAQIKHINKAVKCVDDMRRASEEKLRKLHEDAYLPLNLQKKVEREIRKTVNADYAAMVEDISNEMRRIAAEYGIDIAMVAEYYNLTGNDPMMKVLRQERFTDMLKHSDINALHTPLRAPRALRMSLKDGDKLQVAGGMFYNVDVPELWGMDIHTDLVDGVYTVSVEDGTVYVSRPLVGFVDMSNIHIDMDSRVVFGFARFDEGTAAADIKARLKKLTKDISVGAEVSILRNTSKRKFALLDVDGNEIARLNFGQKGEKLLGSEEPTVLSKGYGDFAGKITNNVISTGAINYNGGLYYNFLVIIKK